MSNKDEILKLWMDATTNMIESVNKRTEINHEIISLQQEQIDLLRNTSELLNSRLNNLEKYVEELKKDKE